MAVPGLWVLEVTNALAVGERRGRLSAGEAAGALRLLARMPIQIDDRAGLPLAADLLALARSHGLSAYDAAYLELALRLSCPLATLDRQLQAAAAAAGVALQAT
jgi:predicted nucleic acid-binding protein